MSEYKYGPDWKMVGIILVIVFVGVVMLLTYMADQGWLDRWLVERVGDDYVGMLIEADGQTWKCLEVSYEGYCTEWDALKDTATDVAKHFGPNVFGVAKGEAPLIPSDQWYAPFLNPINQTVWSLSISLELSVFAILMIAVLVSGTVIVVLVKPNSAGVVLALYSLPAYVAFLSLSSLAGPGWVVALHCLTVPMVGLMFFLKLLSRIHVSTHTRQSVNGEVESSFHLGPAAVGGLSKGSARRSEPVKKRNRFLFF